MEVSRAIDLLKLASTEIERLKCLSYKNNEWTLWRSKINVIIEDTFGKNSSEYKEFNPSVGFVSIGGTEYEHQLSYLRDLESDELGIKKIVQKYEILGIPPVSTDKENTKSESPKVFISHGKEGIALPKIEKFLDVLGIEPLIVKDMPSLDRTVIDKVNDYLAQSQFVIILATCDDNIGGTMHPRQNVIHEIGLAQKTHPGKILYLLEKNAEFPSNILPKVWERFQQDNLENVFVRMIIELRALGILKSVKPTQNPKGK